MAAMGFGIRWRKWIEVCLSSATTSILVNGSPTPKFEVKKGLRQGDPLSPFLYLLTAEALNVVMIDAVNNGIFEDITVGSSNVYLPMLQFADDTIIFGKWSPRNFSRLLCLLNCFQQVSGLRINYEKSMVYGIGVNDEELRATVEGFGCSLGHMPFTYLGVPIGRSMCKIEAWKEVINKFKARLNRWQGRFLSIGGRFTLVKSVLTNLPLYFMSIYKAPKKVIAILESIRARFFWGINDEKKHGIHWVKWSNILSDRSAGGLGIPSIEALNLSLLCKWRWRFVSNSSGLWQRIVKSVFGTSGGFMYGESFQQLGVNKSGTWPRIVKTTMSLDSLCVPAGSAFTKAIGNGLTTSFWDDPWLNNSPLRVSFNRLWHLDQSRDDSIGQKIIRENGITDFNWNWRTEIRGRALSELAELEAQVSQHQFLASSIDDRWVWVGDLRNGYSVKSMRHLITKARYNSPGRFPKTEWCKAIPMKVNIFIWRLRSNSIPVLDRLNDRGIDLHSTLCPICSLAVETREHRFIDCEHSVEVWKAFFGWWKLVWCAFSSIEDICLCRDINDKFWRAVIWIALYCMWRHRNEILYRRANRCSGNGMLSSIISTSYSWIKDRSKSGLPSWESWIDRIQNPDPTTLLPRCVCLTTASIPTGLLVPPFFSIKQKITHPSTAYQLIPISISISPHFSLHHLLHLVRVLQSLSRFCSSNSYLDLGSVFKRVYNTRKLSSWVQESSSLWLYFQEGIQLELQYQEALILGSRKFKPLALF